MQQYLHDQQMKKVAAADARKQELLAERQAAVAHDKQKVHEALEAPALPARSHTPEKRGAAATPTAARATASGESSPSGAVAGYRVASAGAASQGLQDRRVHAIADTRARLFPQKGSQWNDDSTYHDMKARVAKQRAQMLDRDQEHKFVMHSALPMRGGAERAVFTPRSTGAGAAGSGRLAAATPDNPIVAFK